MEPNGHVNDHSKFKQCSGCIQPLPSNFTPVTSIHGNIVSEQLSLMNRMIGIEGRLDRFHNQEMIFEERLRAIETSFSDRFETLITRTQSELGLLKSRFEVESNLNVYYLYFTFRCSSSRRQIRRGSR